MLYFCLFVCFVTFLPCAAFQAPPEVFSTGLSPGLRYLEQVCQKWEDVAKQQLVTDGSSVDRARVITHKYTHSHMLHLFFFFSRFLHMEAILITNNILPLLLSVFQQLSIIRAASASHFLQGSSGEPFRQGQTPQGSSGIFSTEISFRNDRVVNTAAT